MRINLNYEDRKYFHPAPTPRMKETISALLDKFNWQVDYPVDKLTRDEAKELIKKGIQAAKRKNVRIFDTEIDEVNTKLAIV